MYREKIPQRQLTAWIFAAVVPPAIQLMGGASWVWALGTAAVCALGVLIRWRWGEEPQGALNCLLQWLLLVTVLGTLARESVQSWPTGSHVAVPLILLVLAAWAAWKGPSAAARVGCVLFWFLIIMYTVLFVAGVKKINLPWLMPQPGRHDLLPVILLLTPAAAAIHLHKKERFQLRLLFPGIFTIFAAALTLGVLSPTVARGTDNAFYEMTRSLSILGTAQRFEAVLSAAMTTGWFALMCLYLTLCGRMAEGVKQGWGRGGSVIAAAGAAAWVLCGLHISVWVLVALAAVFWVLLPVLTQGIGKIKKS